MYAAEKSGIQPENDAVNTDGYILEHQTTSLLFPARDNVRGLIHSGQKTVNRMHKDAAETSSLEYQRFSNQTAH
jgi:hypothetical protein